jgi:hypothetical protein
MNEYDWQTGTDPLALLDYLFPVRGMDSAEPQSRASRLYLLGCARRSWDRLPGVCRAVVAAAERLYHPRALDRRLRDAVYPLAEALINCRGETADLNAIGRALVALGTPWAEVRAGADIDPDVWVGFAHLAYFPFDRVTPEFHRVPPDLHSAELIREVFPNPFVHQPPFDPAWRTETVTQLARHADTTGDFSALPVLADALQEVGCDRADLLDHLRHGGPHARGCWALELVLTGR